MYLLVAAVCFGLVWLIDEVMRRVMAKMNEKSLDDTYGDWWFSDERD